VSSPNPSLYACRKVHATSADRGFDLSFFAILRGSQNDGRTAAQSQDRVSIELCKTSLNAPLLLTHTYRGNGNNKIKKEKVETPRPLQEEKERPLESPQGRKRSIRQPKKQKPKEKCENPKIELQLERREKCSILVQKKETLNSTMLSKI
jgi:hypothetical protein